MFKESIELNILQLLSYLQLRALPSFVVVEHLIQSRSSAHYACSSSAWMTNLTYLLKIDMWRLPPCRLNKLILNLNGLLNFDGLVGHLLPLHTKFLQQHPACTELICQFLHFLFVSSDLLIGLSPQFRERWVAYHQRLAKVDWKIL